MQISEEQPGVSAAEFEEMVDHALGTIPPALLDQMENVAIFVEDLPPANDPMLLGLYEGTPLTERGDSWASGALPDRITIFRLPLMRISADRDELIRQIRVTVVHEVAHHFGIDDQRLHELGWA